MKSRHFTLARQGEDLLRMRELYNGVKGDIWHLATELIQRSVQLDLRRRENDNLLFRLLREISPAVGKLDCKVFFTKGGSLLGNQVSDLD